MRYLTIALAKGRLAEKAMEMFEAIGISCDEMKDKASRKLIFVNEDLGVRFFLAKANDVPTYVEYGAADIGIVGRDTILEEGRKLYEVMDLGMGMLSRYQYYTGIIFKAYTYGTGDYIVTGGRYDKLLVQFGKDTPAVGFVIVVDQLMAALSRQQIDVPVTLVNTVILYETSARSRALWLGSYFRDKGLAVQSMKKKEQVALEDYKAMAIQRGMRNVLYLKGDGTVVTAMDTVNGNTDQIPITAYE